MKEYALFVGENATELDNDQADWYATFNAAYKAALEAVRGKKTREALILGFDENGDCDDEGRRIIRDEHGDIKEYHGDMLLWA